MSRDRDERPPVQDPDDPRPDPSGRLSTTTAGTVIGCTLVGLVVGWLVRPVSVRLSGIAPTVSWLPALTLLFAAAVVGAVAWSTYRLIHHRRERLEPHRAVNRLVLAKACTLAGALAAGGYLGSAISWLGLQDSLLARARLVHSLAAAVAGVLLVVGALLLERACRVHRSDR